MTFIAPADKLYDHLDALQQIRETGWTSAPVNAEIDLSNRCSLGCEFCHFAYTHTRGPLAGKRDKPADVLPGGDLMATSLALDIIRQLSEAGCQSITWTGGGEPTLHPEFDAIVGYAVGLIKQGLYTHGGHMTPERASLLKRSCTFVYVSLDAADADSYRRAKGVDRFGAACDGVRLLAEADGNATIGVGFLIDQNNYQSVSDAARLAERLGADYLQVRPIIRYAQDDPARAEGDTSWIDEALRNLEKARYYQPNIVFDAQRFRNLRDWSGHDYPVCWWSAFQTCVTPNGMVWRCVNTREHPAQLVGDLTIESFADIWARQQVRAIDADCRVMCRGDLANRELARIYAKRKHPEFV